MDIVSGCAACGGNGHWIFQDMLVLGGVRHGFTNPAQAGDVFDV